MNRTNLFLVLAEAAAIFRDLDERITYAPISIGADHVQMSLQVESDEAVADLAARFDLGPPRRAGNERNWWMVAERWVKGAYVSITGPHHRHVIETADTWSPAHQERQ